MKMFINYGHQCIDEKDIKAVINVLRSDFITQGPKIREFEQALCHYTGARYAAAVSSGTAALHIACLAGEITKGDEVITTPVTFAASANCILYCKARPVFADTEIDTVNIDPLEIKRKITKRTKAIIPVDFAGHPCDLEEIKKIADRHGLLVIEDACHALGSVYKGAKIGSCKLSDMAIFSFHPVKSITTGEGGVIVTNNKNIYEKLLKLRNHGITKDKTRLSRKNQGSWYYEMQDLGFNYRLSDIQAALGISQLMKLDKFIAKRKLVAKRYNKEFKDNPYFTLPAERDYVSSAWHLYPIRLKDKFRSQKKEIFAQLRKEGLGVQVHYIPVYKHPFYQRLGLDKMHCANAEDFYSRAISIPIYSSLSVKEQDFVIKAISEVFKAFD